MTNIQITPSWQQEINNVSTRTQAGWQDIYRVLQKSIKENAGIIRLDNMMAARIVKNCDRPTKNPGKWQKILWDSSIYMTDVKNIAKINTFLFLES
ncbi:MAG: hypothetical protein HOE48_00680 [Candidatus Latescibacteria bacterium]|jgi:hypothetical protein|nr:hypothetical protein [Candidatus Latescibacterota bacterium]MBT4136391.1 hypothetical protein [Candidatus Latescibacterota bacterium]